MNSVLLEDVANSIFRLRMYPYFDISSYILMSIAVKEDIPQSGFVDFSRKHPFSCWFATMLMCFGGVILSNFICGSPLFQCFDDYVSVATATVVWYFINYFPFDIIYRLCKFTPFRLIICALKEVQRAKKIYLGVHHGLHLYPTSPVMCVLLGLLKGAGSSFMHTAVLYVMGVWKPKQNPFLVVDLTTKLSLLAAIGYYCHSLELIPLPQNQLFLAFACLFVYLRVTMILLGLKDPFIPFENALCTLLFGGTVDAIRNAFARIDSKFASKIHTSHSSTNLGTPTSATNTANGSNTQSQTANQNASNPSGNTQTNANNATNTTGGTGMRDSIKRQGNGPSDKKRD